MASKQQLRVKFDTKERKSELHLKVAQVGGEADVRQMRLFGTNCSFVGQAPFADDGANIKKVTHLPLLI